MRRVAIGVVLLALVAAPATASDTGPDLPPHPTDPDVSPEGEPLGDPLPSGSLDDLLPGNGLPIQSPVPKPDPSLDWPTDGSDDETDTDEKASPPPLTRHRLVDNPDVDHRPSTGARPHAATMSSGGHVPTPEPAHGPTSSATLRVAGLVAAGGLAAWLLLRGLPEDPTRRHLLRLIRRRPGRNLTDLADELDVDRTTVRYHVDKLADDDRVTCRRVGRCRRVFPAGDAADAEHADLLDHPVRQAIVRRLKRGPPVRQRRLAERCDVAPSTLTYHLDRLADAGLIERDQDGRSAVLSLADDRTGSR